MKENLVFICFIALFIFPLLCVSVRIYSTENLSTLQCYLSISYDFLKEITFLFFTFDLNIHYWVCLIHSTIDNTAINEINFWYIKGMIV